jgi:hypothetical protein
MGISYNGVIVVQLPRRSRKGWVDADAPVLSCVLLCSVGGVQDDRIPEVRRYAFLWNRWVTNRFLTLHASTARLPSSGRIFATRRMTETTRGRAKVFVAINPLALRNAAMAVRND